MWSCFYPLSVALCLVSLLAPRCDAATGQRRYKIDLLRNESIEEEAHVIRVAASSSMYWSDTFVRYGRDMVRGWEMFAQWLNKERGGIVLNGTAHSIVFDFIQDYSSNSLVTNVYKSLLKDYDLFFSPYSSGLSRSAADVTDPAGKFLLATGASNTAVFRNRKSSFTTLPPNLEFLDSSFAAFAGYGSKTVAVIKDTDYAACGTAQDSNNSAIKAGLTLYKHYDVDPASSYYSSTVRSIIAELKEHSVESVMGCTYLPLCYEVVNSSRIQDYNPQGIVLNTCLDSPAFMNWAGKNARGLMMPTVWEKSVQLIDKYTGWTPLQFSEMFKDAYGYSPTYHAANAFNAGEILMDAIEKTQSLDPMVLADTMRKSYFETIYANVSFDGNNQITADLLIVQSLYDKSYTTIYPKFTEAIYPIPTWKMKQCEIDTDDCSGHGRCSTDGQCICDDQYYGKVNTDSCETYCDGERAYDFGRQLHFCKSKTTFQIGAVTTIHSAEEPEFRAMFRLAAELINNKTDGFFDNNTAQVYFKLAEDGWECSSESGFSSFEALDLRVQNETGSGLSAIIEPDCSLVSETASNYGDRHAIVQMAFGSTAMTLSDKTSYPLFARSCPSDAEQAQIIVDLLYHYSLTNISIVSVSDDTYSSSLASMIISRFTNRDGKKGNIIRHESYIGEAESHNASFYDAMMDRLASYGAATTVITTMFAEAEYIFDAVKRHHIMSSDKFLWVWPSDLVNANLSNVPLGSLGVTMYSLNASDVMASRFLSLWKSLDPSEYPDLDGDRSTLSSYSSFALDAVFSLALAFQLTINSNYVGSMEGMRQDVYERLVDSVEFDGVSGMFRLNANGDREGSVYEIRNYQGNDNWAVIGYSKSQNKLLFSDSAMVWPDGVKGPAHSSAYSLQHKPECPAGFEPKAIGGLYYCDLCEVGYYKPTTGNQPCSLCPEGTDCEDVGIVVPCILEGYWRPLPPQGEEGDFEKWPVFTCDVTKRCMGGCNLNATCAANVLQTSPVCGVCLDGYYGTGATCTKCPSSRSRLKATEIALVIMMFLVVFCLLVALFSFFIQSVTGINVFAVEIAPIAVSQSRAKQRYESVTSEGFSHERFKSTISDGILLASRFVSGLKSQGLFVTAKLTISFVQVLMGTLPRLDLDVDGISAPSFVFSLDLNPINYVPILSECTSGDTLERPFLHILVILLLPILFLVMTYIVRMLIVYMMRRNAPRRLASSSLAVDRAMFDVTLKAVVWFCLFSFPILASGTLSYFDCRDMGTIGVYMREDYSVRCDNNPTYSGFLVVASLCVLLYPIGIPVFFYRLVRGRDQDWARVGSNALHMNFLPEWAYFEVFELFRKLMLTSIVAFVMPGTRTQVMYLFAVDILALLVLVMCRPYASDSDDFLSVMLVLTECTLFFTVFLLVSEVYTVDNYSREGMLNTCFSLVIVGFTFFVPMNVAAKIPATHRLLESWSAMATAQLSKLGIKVTRLWKLDARSRYQQEIEELRESINEIRLSQAIAKTQTDRPGVTLSTNSYSSAALMEAGH